MTGKLTPVGYDYGGNPEYDEPPIEHTGYAENSDREQVHFHYWSCPNCGEELDFRPSHDVYTEGFAPEARPDQWRCLNCDYTWTE